MKPIFPLTNPVFLARHGETKANREGKILGISDSLLTEKGIKTTEEIAKNLKNHGITLIISSPLGRAITTSAIISEKIKIPVITDNALRELSCGLWEEKKRIEILPSGGALRKNWEDKPPEGESFADREKEIEEFVLKVISLSAKHTLLLTGHSGINQLFLKILYNLHAIPLSLPGHPCHIIYRLSQEEVMWINSSGMTEKGWWK
jgi:broad specificity phosphatase PhoE